MASEMVAIDPLHDVALQVRENLNPVDGVHFAPYMTREGMMQGAGVSDRIVIFDTTLRDGEQSPGCSMNIKEKDGMAGQLDDLGAGANAEGSQLAIAAELPVVS